MRPFGCPVTILNTLDHLGKFDGKANEGFFIGYSVNSKAFRVFNSITGSGPEWLFDIDTLTKSMKYKPVVAENQTNGNAGTKESIDAGQAGKSSSKRSDDEVADDARKKSTKDPANEGDKDDQDLRDEFESSPINTVGTKDADDEPMMPNLEDTGIFGDAYDDEDF
ncbi:hypothetical protein Tco_1208204, partial [Tanacetum coccineum]